MNVDGLTDGGTADDGTDDDGTDDDGSAGGGRGRGGGGGKGGNVGCADASMGRCCNVATAACIAASSTRSAGSAGTFLGGTTRGTTMDARAACLSLSRIRFADFAAMMSAIVSISRYREG